MKNVFLFILILLPVWSSAQTGNVGINTISPLAMLHIKDGSVLYEGGFTVNELPNPTPVFGTGVRMMWYPDKAAFRSGRAVENSWDQSNIGNHSFGAGYGVIASGLNAMAFGQHSVASGVNSFAAGDNARATSGQSFALGLNSLASGFISFASGFGAQATGGYSMAIGSGSTASASQSLAIGYNAEALGTLSTSIGSYARAHGDNANAFGHDVSAKGLYATSIGYGTQANAIGSVAIGAYNDTIVSTLQGLNDDTPLFIIGNGQSSTTRSNALVINHGGEVGIGTNLPAYRLDVKVNTPNAQISRFSSGGGYGEIIVHNSSHTSELGISQDWGYVGTKTAKDFIIRTGTFTRMLVQHPTGHIGINTVSPNYTLDVNGTAGKPGGGSWIATSDARLKHNVTNYTDGLSSLLQIRPVYYQYNSISGYDTTKQHIGIIAQELQQVAPYMVNTSSKEATDGTTNYLEVDNSAMVYMLINAVKEQQAIIGHLEQRIVELEKN